MRRTAPSLFGLVAAVLLAVGCSEDASGPGTPAPAPRVKEELPAPGPLVAGVATVKLPAPVGIATMGYGSLNAKPSVTAFSEQAPGTTKQQGALTLKAVALSRGPAHELVIVRTDTIGVFQQLRQAVVDGVRARTGRDVSQSLVLAANHTHSGPGRLLQAIGTLEALADKFFPEHYDRLVAAFVEVVVRALEDQKPAEIGHVLARSSDAHNDRRCENNPLPQLQEDPTMPVIAVRRAGVVDAVVASYAYHGTVLGLDDLTLSGDMGAVVEQKIAESFDHPVTVLFLNSWGADMSPGDAGIDAALPASEIPERFERMEGLGVKLASVVRPAVDSIAFRGDAEVRTRTYVARLDREVMEYDDETFVQFPHGGAFCGFGGEGSCDAVSRLEALDELCVKAVEGELPTQTMISAGQVGALAFVTGPGEWSTNLAARVLDKARARTGGDVMFIGYAQDFTGYSLDEADWWQGGYETSGALWGPKQGEYLAARAIESFETFFDTFTTPPFPQPSPLAPFSGYAGYAPYAPEAGKDVGTIAVDVPEVVGPTDLVTFTVRGSDPWLGTPVAVLERGDGGGAFAPVTKRNTQPVDSDSYDMWVHLAVDPPYVKGERLPERSFAWTFHFPVTRRTATAFPPLTSGTPHRITVKVPTPNGDVSVSSRPFALQ